MNTSKLKATIPLMHSAVFLVSHLICRHGCRKGQNVMSYILKIALNSLNEGIVVLCLVASKLSGYLYTLKQKYFLMYALITV